MCSLKLNFAAYLITLYFWGNERSRPLPPPPSCIPLSAPFFLGFLFLAFLHQRLLTLKRVVFLEHKFAAFVFNLQAPVVQKVNKSQYPTDSAVGVSNTLCPLDNGFSGG